MSFRLPLRCLGRLCAPALLASLAPAQDRFLWSDTFDGPGQAIDLARALVLGPHGRVFVAGSSAGASDGDALFVAYDAYGERIWERRVDLGSNEAAGAIAYDAAAGALYAGGTVRVGAWYQWLVWRLSPQDGTVRWQRQYAGPQGQGGVPLHLALDASGGIAVGGYSGAPHQYDALVARFDSSGSLSWEWSAPTPGSILGSCPWIAADPAGDLVIRVAELINGTTYTLHKLDPTGAPVWSRVLGATSGGTQGPFIDASSELVYSINGPTTGGRVIAKLDAAGNPLWSVDATAIFGAMGYTSFLGVDASGDVVALSWNSLLARLDPVGNLLWTRSLADASSFDVGLPSGLAVDANGDAVLRLRGHTPGESLAFDLVARWDLAGNFLWSQAVRSFEPDTEVETKSPLVLAPLGAVLLAGSTTTVGSTTSDWFVAALREQSRRTCFGDGSAGPCPCGNQVPPGTESGCRTPGSSVGPTLEDTGIASLGSDSLRVYATRVTAGGIAMLLQGRPAPAALPLQDGLLCMSGPIRRLYTITPSSWCADLPPAGDPSIHERAAALGDPIPPGSSRVYQVYLRGGPGQCQAGNGNLTNAVVVDWAP